MDNSKAPGKTYLQVTGTLMVIFSSLSLIALLIGGAVVGGLIGGVGGAATGISLFLFALIPCIFQLYVGIQGIRHCNKLDKGKNCFILGIILLVLDVISLFASFSITRLIFLVVPILFVMGAYKNDKAFAVN